MYTSMLSLFVVLNAVHLTYGVSPPARSCFSRETCDLRINNNCYVHVDQSVNWYEAEACCVAWGGYLASIHSEGTNHLLNQIRNIDRFTWIGLSDTANDGVYVWADGTAFDYNNFHPNQPDSLRGESCFHFFDKVRGELTWNDYHCNRNSWVSVNTSYICQKVLRPQMDRSRCDIKLNGKCYISIDTRSTWNSAEDSCVEWGGHLASIHSDLENYAVNSIRDTRDFTWIGLSDTANDGVYVWTDGTAFDYNNFSPNQPDNLGGESCFHFFDKSRGELTWNDYHCDRENWGSVETSFVCKKDIDTCTAQCSPCTRIACAIMGERGYPGLQGPGGGGGGYVGQPGVPGSPGPSGSPGVVGPKGERGYPGPHEEQPRWNGDVKGGNGWNREKGEKGERGFTGPQGSEGERGYVGQPGVPGFFGPSGIPGAVGPRGYVGLEGASGYPGLNGAEGERGLPGPQGPVGPRGNVGLVGASGYPGLNGTEGEKGERGLSGPQGSVGPRGDVGLVGASGSPGLIGTEGEKGERGLSGPQGPEGEIGYVGQSGVPGKRGKRGPSGIPGVVGPAGANGEKGERGYPGPQGSVGPRGHVGLVGASGYPGFDGAEGEKGEKGERGDYQDR